MKDLNMNEYTSTKSVINFLVQQLDAFEDEHLSDKDKATIQKVFVILGRTPKLAILDEIVKEYKTYYNNITRNDLPLALAEAGLSSVKTDDGIEVTTKTEYTTKTLNKESVVAWLDEHGYGNIVKDSLMLEKGQFDDKLEAMLAKMGVSYTRDSAINGSQLKSVVRQHMEGGGTPPPSNAMAIECFVEAKIKRPKAGL